jgi:hypothetical protein
MDQPKCLNCNAPMLHTRTSPSGDSGALHSFECKVCRMSQSHSVGKQSQAQQQQQPQPKKKE